MSRVGDGADSRARARASRSRRRWRWPQRARALKAKGEQRPRLQRRRARPAHAAPHRRRAARPRSTPAARATRPPPASPSCAPRSPSATARTSSVSFADRGGHDHASAASRRCTSLCQALLDRGDEVVIPSPHWPTFARGGAPGRRRPILVPRRRRTASGSRRAPIAQGHQPEDARRSSSTAPRTPRAPSSTPTTCWHRRHGAAPQVHGCSTTTPTPASSSAKAEPPPLQELQRRGGRPLVVVGTASKSYCMTGWRIGWVLGPKALVDAATALISHSTQCPATFAQVAAAEALHGPQDELRRMAAEYRRRRDFVHPRVAAIPGVVCPEPAGGFYVFPTWRAISRRRCPTRSRSARSCSRRRPWPWSRARLPRARHLPPLVRAASRTCRRASLASRLSSRSTRPPAASGR